MNQALEKQVGGLHYKGLSIQPVLFCSVNQYDPAAFSTLKYVTRHASKNGLEDLNKAGHFIELRVQLRRENPCLANVNVTSVITMDTYVLLNEIPPDEAGILQDLHFWALGQSKLPDTTLAHHILQRIERLKVSKYPK